MLEKETAVPPLRIRLKHALELKLTRILVRVNHGNSVFERLKKEKKKKKPNFDTKINYLIDTPQGDSLAGQISSVYGKQCHVVIQSNHQGGRHEPNYQRKAANHCWSIQ